MDNNQFVLSRALIEAGSVLAAEPGDSLRHKSA